MRLKLAEPSPIRSYVLHKRKKIKKLGHIICGMPGRKQSLGLRADIVYLTFGLAGCVQISTSVQVALLVMHLLH